MKLPNLYNYSSPTSTTLAERTKLASGCWIPFVSNYATKENGGKQFPPSRAVNIQSEWKFSSLAFYEFVYKHFSLTKLCTCFLASPLNCFKTHAPTRSSHKFSLAIIDFYYAELWEENFLDSSMFARRWKDFNRKWRCNRKFCRLLCSFQCESLIELVTIISASSAGTKLTHISEISSSFFKRRKFSLNF